MFHIAPLNPPLLGNFESQNPLARFPQNDLLGRQYGSRGFLQAKSYFTAANHSKKSAIFRFEPFFCISLIHCCIA